MDVATNPNNTNLFPNSLTLHIYKTILLFITIHRIVLLGRVRRSTTSKDTHRVAFCYLWGLCVKDKICFCCSKLKKYILFSTCLIHNVCFCRYRLFLEFSYQSNH